MKKRILVAPLNWGIGHATRCIPIINWLLDCNFTPIIASDGDALLLLQKEFSSLEAITLPAFNIQYQKKVCAGNPPSRNINQKLDGTKIQYSYARKERVE